MIGSPVDDFGHQHLVRPALIVLAALAPVLVLFLAADVGFVNVERLETAVEAFADEAVEKPCGLLRHG